MKAEETRTFSLANGSLIQIPAFAFVDFNGMPVQGEILLKYREFIQTSDIISSGIPMMINKLEDKYPLETAGLFEIIATKDGERIFIAPGKFIEINMASSWGAEDFDNYYLDPNAAPIAALSDPLTTTAFAQEIAPQWKLLGKSSIIPTANLVQENTWLMQKRDVEIDSLARELELAQEALKLKRQHEKVVTKAIPSTQSTCFTLSLNTDENPELNKYTQAIWQYMGENESESPSINNQWVLNEKWDAINLTSLKYKPLSLKGHNGAVNTAVFSTNGQYVLTASEDHTAKLWTNDASYICTLKGHSAAVNHAVFSPDDQYIVTASDDHTAKIWSQQGRYITTLSGHSGVIHHVSFNNHGDYILTTSADNTAKLWNAHGQILFTLPHIRANSPACFSPDGNYVLTISSDSTANVWTLRGDVVATIDGPFNSAAFSPNSKKIVTTSKKVFSGSAALWSVKGKLLRSFDLNDVSAQFSPDGQYLLSTTGNGSRLWYLNPAESFNTILIRNLKNLPKKYRKGHEGLISSVQFSKYGDYIITASKDQTVKIWDRNGWIQHTLRQHTAPVNTAVYSPDGKSILTASDDHTAKIWIERKVGNVFELELIKEPKYFDSRKNSKVKLAGKKFYTIVREIDPADIPQEKIKQPNLESNPVLEIEEHYKKALEARNRLEKIQMTGKTVYLRKFKVRKLGIYGSNRVYRNNFPISCLSDLQINAEPNFDVLQVFLISGEHQSAIQELSYQKNEPVKIQFDPLYPCKIMAVLSGDRVAIFSTEHSADFRYSDLEYKQPFEFDLKYYPVVHSIKELNILLDNKGSSKNTLKAYSMR